MHVAVVGAGSLGSLLGGLLAREHRVTLVGRDPHVSAIREHGLRVTGVVNLTISPDADTTAPARCDLALVTTKAFDTAGAAATLADTDAGCVVSLQNGLGNETVLRDRLDCPVLAGTCTYGARRSDPGVVACTGEGTVTVGDPDGGPSEWADRVADAFTAADIDATASDEMPLLVWQKLAVNVGINATTALARTENGALLDGPASSVAAAAARETATVARSEGVDLADETATDAVERVARNTRANRSSMLQDIDARRRTEVDAIVGPVADHAEPTPVAATLAGLLRAWEAERGLR
ncbi:2-dehydropantoate 2-reductase [Halosegnis rubeus]|jgi:2-dehydropantoate 2-reductase|uniref:2-dehydropantoate 2-reductase n=1 Tax=Halosegnis rubeus TaxID=2212850 RepID=A0A5N5UF92_9EURY|nr:ketopantoate reductase family protein [Halosegnis rubeus]KAB7516142.1 2-dehydropantoate 2-reductase [Halosegnis rubeus]